MYGNCFFMSKYILEQIDKPQHIMYGNPFLAGFQPRHTQINLNI